jgi:hypothetical protein
VFAQPARFRPNLRAFQGRGLQARVQAEPGAISPETMLGTLVHATLCSAARLRVGDRAIAVDRDLIDSLWEVEWRMLSPGARRGHYDLYLAGRTMLRHYVASPNFRDRQTYVISVNGPTGPERRPMLEFPFHLVTDDGGVISGRFDRVDNRDGHPVVVDYKTGVISPEALRRYQEQMRLYALAICDLTGATSVECELHWVRTNTVTHYRFDRAELEAQRAATISWALRQPSLARERPPQPPGQAGDGLGL